MCRVYDAFSTDGTVYRRMEFGRMIKNGNYEGKS